MITLKNCIEAVAAALERLVSIAPIARSDLQGVTDPGLYIVPADIQSEMIGENRHDMYELVVAWYGNRATDRYIDLLEMQAIFAGLFMAPIAVPGEPAFFIYPEQVRYDLDAQEGTLFATFIINIYQSPDTTEDEDKPTVEELDMDGDVINEVIT